MKHVDIVTWLVLFTQGEAKLYLKPLFFFLCLSWFVTLILPCFGFSKECVLVGLVLLFGFVVFVFCCVFFFF